MTLITATDWHIADAMNGRKLHADGEPIKVIWDTFKIGATTLYAYLGLKTWEKIKSKDIAISKSMLNKNLK